MSALWAAVQTYITQGQINSSTKVKHKNWNVFKVFLKFRVKIHYESGVAEPSASFFKREINGRISFIVSDKCSWPWNQPTIVLDSSEHLILFSLFPFFNYGGSEPTTAAVSVSHLSRLRQAVLVSITSSCGRTGGAVGSQGGDILGQ